MRILLEFDEIIEIDNFLIDEEENFKFTFESELEEFDNILSEGLSPQLAKKFASKLKAIVVKRKKMIKAVQDKGKVRITKLKSAGKHKEAKKLKATMSKKSQDIQDNSLEAEQTIRAKMQKAREDADKYNN